MKNDSLLIDTLHHIQNNLDDYVENIKNNVDDLNFLTAGYKFGSNTTVIDNLISSGQIELLRSNYLVEDILVYYRQAEHVEITIEAAILAQNKETVNNLMLHLVVVINQMRITLKRLITTSIYVSN